MDGKMKREEYEETLKDLEQAGIFESMRIDLLYPWEQATQRAGAFIEIMNGLSEKERCVFLIQLLKMYHQHLSSY